MFILLLFTLFFNVTSPGPDEGKNVVSNEPVIKKTIESKIKTLKATIKPKKIKMIKKVLTKWMPKFGIKDTNLLLSMIKTESNFNHIHGTSGEWGMLQVIPYEQHIKNIARRYRCFKGEKYCICPGQKTTCKVKTKPDIYYFKKGKYYVSSRKLRRFVKYNPRAAIAIGIGEVKFWKNRYEMILKKRFWNYFPKTHIASRIEKHYPDYTLKRAKRWWYWTRKNLKHRCFIVHYNYGGVLRFSKIARSYPYRINRYLKQIE